ncbi:protein translocase subunit SecF [Motilimonas sp. 1_MG-2023]|uniref:Protein-export membrane protein SecF n=2 Tax=Motilimonas cestriensis TaxID=2742685 RepID=A0ABS8W9T1_9GAMM|nr:MULTISPECIES: protein translocase subunit SecF [Motilimonas]MCE2595769.1 protein translocase subunit SecF [Motilimonas cestriensis]MDO6525213.1 protein translocase subunit SecF [Motilimonas sp. 1_MG-2023]
MKNASQWRYGTSVISILLLCTSLFFIVTKGFNWGLDFTGGVVSEIQVSQQITNSELSPLLEAGLGQKVSVVASDEPGRWVIRYSVPENMNTTAVSIEALLAPLSGEVQVLNTSIVGPQVGQELAEQGGLALLVCMLCIMVYLSIRFEWRLALGSLVALVHDVVFVLGFFALSQMEFNLTVLAAVLAILGYSLNDSIIIADRIRELLRLKPDAATADINNQAIAATFTRTMITSGTTLITVSALWLLGGASLAGFAIAMFIGILAGTWSSIAVGTSLPEVLGLKPEHYQEVALPDTP